LSKSEIVSIYCSERLGCFFRRS